MSGKNLRVNLIANTSQFKSAMTESSNQIKLLNSEFKSAAAETDKYGNRLDATGAKKKQLNGIIEQYRTRIVAIKNEQRHWTNELKKGNITETEHAQKQQELARRLNNTEAEMKRYEGQLKRINAEGKATTRTYADFDKQFRQVGTTMRNVGAQVGITAGVGFVAMKRVLGDVVSEAKDFYAQMSEMQAISGATGAEMEKLTKQSKDLGKATKFTAQEAAESQANLARAGFNTNEIMGAMPGLLELAASSNLELGNAADITSNIIRTFGFEAEKAGKVADVLAKGAATANTDVAGLGESMKTAGPVAKSLGIQFESVAAATGLMADAGIDGSQAGRMLRQGMLRLSKPTGEAGKLIEKMGVDVFDASGNMKSLDKVVAELQVGMKGYTGQQKAAALATIFGSESTAGWTVLLDQGADSLKKYTADLENSEGAAKAMSDTMQDNAEGSIIRMQSALSGLKIELGEKLLPTLAKGADFIGDLANKMAEWDEETISTIAETALLVTAVLGVTTAVGGLVAGIGAFMAVAGPVGLAIAGGTLLLGGLAAAIYTNQQKTKALKEEQEQAATEAIRYGEGLSEGTKQGVKGYVDLYEGAKMKMLELKTMSGKEAQATSAEVVQAFSEMTDAVIAELEVQKDKLSRAINEVYAVAGEAGVEAAGEMSDKVIESFDADIAEYKQALDVIKQVQQEFSGDVSKLPEDLKVAYQEALTVMGDGAREFAQTQEELQIIQQNIADRQGGVMFEEVEGFVNRINETYAKSIEAANEWSSEKQGVFEQALTQGRIGQEEFNSLMASTEATTAQMIAESVQEQERSLEALAGNLDERGKLIDLATGEEFERLTWLHENSAGVRTAMEESEYEYYQRWKEHNQQVVEDTVNFSEATLNQQKETLIAALEALGMTREDAVKEAEALMKDTLEELGKGEEEAQEAGKKKGDAHKEGLESTKGDNEKAGEGVAGSVLEYMEKYKDESGQAGKDKGDAHKTGLESTKEINESVSLELSTSVSNLLGKTTDGDGGKSAGTQFKTGLDSTKGANESSSTALNLAVSSILGATTDGDGGTSAGSMFNTGILSFRGQVNTSGTTVATSGRDGLASVKTNQTGIDFVSGFSGAISSGGGVGGSVWTAAANLGRSALRALKGAIDSHSPSEETREEGFNFIQGFAFAIKDGTGTVIKSATKLGIKAVTSLADGIKNKKDEVDNVTVRLTKQIEKITKKSNDEINAVNKKAKAEANKLEKRSQEDINLIYAKAKKAKRKLTQQESVRVRRLEEDTAAKVKKVYEKSKKDIEKIEKDKAKKLDEAREKEFQNSKDWIERKKEQQDLSLTEELAAWERVQARYEEGTKQRIEADKNVLQMKEEIHDKLMSLNDEYITKMQDVNDEYEQKVEQRMQSIRNSFGLFDEVKSGDTVYGDNLIDNLQDQVTALESWADNLKTLAQRGIDEGLLKELQEMGPKSASEIAALVEMTDEQMLEFEELWRTKSELAKEQALYELEDFKEKSEEKLEELQEEWISRVEEIRHGTKNEFGNMPSDLNWIGNQAITGMINGMEAMRGPLMEKARSLADAVRAEIQRALDINSPSRVMHTDVGEPIPAGIAGGIEDNISMVKEAMRKVSEVFKAKTHDFKVDFGKLDFAINDNKSNLKVKHEHEINNSGVEKKLDVLIDLLAKGFVGGNKPEIHQHIEINSPDPTSPSENARKFKQASRQLAMELR